MRFSRALPRRSSSKPRWRKRRRRKLTRRCPSHEFAAQLVVFDSILLLNTQTDIQNASYSDAHKRDHSSANRRARRRPRLVCPLASSAFPRLWIVMVVPSSPRSGLYCCLCERCAVVAPWRTRFWRARSNPAINHIATLCDGLNYLSALHCAPRPLCSFLLFAVPRVCDAPAAAPFRTVAAMHSGSQ